MIFKNLVIGFSNKKQLKMIQNVLKDDKYDKEYDRNIQSMNDMLQELRNRIYHDDRIYLKENKIKQRRKK